ncbi:DnaB-like helicase C-terminal domain-containing protein [Selenomonas ruminantium]|uniref:DnaB-like helicase C-terminal domain-containing protein n=1 Tax=Selenomonas ruminantium TaxID=971 RepID=UPI0026EC5E79|nr:DnaB-like helicase C-terminal domain-containing protein [Selenomonas ruminantium]
MNIIDVIRGKSLVEYIPDLKLQSDGTYRCACPIHGGENPSTFVVYPDNKFYCFSCQASGDIIHFVMGRDGCSFEQAVHTLCDDFGLTISDTDEYKQHLGITERNTAWIQQMKAKLPAVIEYLHKRGLTDETIESYGLGYSDKIKALTIPMYDEWGRPVAFLYRYFEGKPKYKNSKNVKGLFTKGEFLFGLPQALKHLKDTKTIILCEGSFDAMSAVQQGNCAVAYCGISVTKNHVEHIKSLLTPIENGKVVLCPDNDGKASKFVRRARDLFKKHAPKIVVKVAEIPSPYKDFNDMLVAGRDIVTDCRYVSLDLYVAKQVVSESDDREVQEKNIVDFVRTVENPMIRQDIAEFLAKMWQRDIGIVRELLSIKEDTTEERMKDIASAIDSFHALEAIKDEEYFGVGYPNVDKAAKFKRKNVVILGAASNSGKTEILLEWILHWVVKLRKTVLFFSLEMPKEDIMKILVAKIIGIRRYDVPGYIAMNPNLITMISDKLEKHLFIVDKPGLTLDMMEEYVKLTNARLSPVDIVAVDYFQKMRGRDTLADEEVVAEKTKDFAKDLNVLFVLLSQLNKSGQGKEQGGRFHEPEQKDLRGSGAIGDSGDYVYLLWRKALDSTLSPIDREKYKYDSMIKLVKARERRSEDTLFNLVYDPEKSRLTEKISS